MVEIKDPVGLTSRIIAAVRAIETQRPGYHLNNQAKVKDDCSSIKTDP